jgi:hypothetical protein
MPQLRLIYGKHFAPSGLGFHKSVFGLRHLHVFVEPHFMCVGIASQFLYRAQKNVVYLFTLE